MFLSHIELGINGPLHTKSDRKLITAREETAAFLATASLYGWFMRLDISHRSVLFNCL